MNYGTRVLIVGVLLVVIAGAHFISLTAVAGAVVLFLYDGDVLGLHECEWYSTRAA